MTLGSKLRSHLPEGQEQKVVAMTWIARVEELGGKPLAATTAPSRLSQLFADDPEGVRAFFRDPLRATALFDVLAVPEAERDALRALAEPAFAGTPQPRLVVDLSDLPAGRGMDTIFAGVREALLGDDGLFPLTLVLTDAQYDLLPRSFDRFKERVHVEQVADATKGAEAARRLAGDDVCVASQRPLVELVRWWALSATREGLAFEPEDGLTRLRTTGRIGVPAVAHPLTAANAGALRGSPKIPDGGVERRRLVERLADERSDLAEKEPAWRFAAAEALGVKATSSERERIEAEITAVTAAVGVPVGKATQAEWDALVARAARRPVEPTALRIGDAVHVLNPAGELSSAGRLVVARVACAEPALVTLERAIAEWTEDDLLDDPLLGRVIHRLAAGDANQLKLLFHARAVLVLGGRVGTRAPEAVKEPLAVLGHLLAADVPEAQLRVRTSGDSQTYGSKATSVQLDPFVYPSGRMYFDVVKDARLLYDVPPVGDVLWTRADGLRGVVPRTGREEEGEGAYVYHYDWNGAGRPSTLVNPAADASAWLDDVEASLLFGGRGAVERWGRKTHLPEPKQGHTWQDIPEPEELWLTADTNLALAWLAVRDALVRPRSIRMPDGNVLLQVGGGLAARVHVRRHGAKDAPLRAAVRATANVEVDYHGHGSWSLGDLAAPVTTHVAHTGDYTSRLSVLMPAIWLSGRGFAADIRFLPAPMLPGVTQADTLASGVAGAVAAIDVAARDAELQAMYDDD